MGIMSETPRFVLVSFSPWKWLKCFFSRSVSLCRLEALRTLVPHSARANTAAFLTEVYDYISSLHKQLDRVGAAVLDLNVAASDENKKPQEITGHEKREEVRRTVSRKRTRDSKSDDESEVESEDRCSSEDYSHTNGNAGQSNSVAARAQEEKQLQPLYTTVLAPSLYDPAVSKPDTAGETRVDWPVPSGPSQTSADALHHDTRLSAFSPPATAADSCSTQMTLGIGASHGPTTPLKPR